MTQALTTEEQKYFDTKGGAEIPAEKVETKETPKTEEKAEAKPETKAEVKTEEKVVPLRALQEEREEAKRLKAELAAQREMIARGNQRLEQLAQAMQPKQQLPEDPVERIEARIQNVTNTVEGFTQAQQQQAQWTNFRNAVQAHEAHFVRENPDYYDALAHIRQSRIQEYEDFGASPQEARARVNQEEAAIAQSALQRGENPAKKIYDAAVRRGYAKKATNPVTPEKTLETVAKGQEAAKSLNVSPGGSTPNIDLAALAKMDEDDFAAFVKDPKKWRKVWGE